MATPSRQELGQILRDGMAKAQSVPMQEIATDTTPVNEEETVIDQEIEQETVETEITEELEELETEEETEIEASTSDADEDSEIRDLGQLAKAIEVDPEFLYNIEIPMADGMEPMTLSELKDGYTELQRGSSAQLEALEREREAFERHQAEQREAIKLQMQMPQEILTAHAQVLAIQSQFQNFNWEALEKDNPGEAALLKTNMNAAYQQAIAAHQQALTKWQQQQEADANNLAAKERKQILRHIPAWREDSVRVKDQDKMRVMLKEYGYNDQEIDGIDDHRAMRIAHDLMQLKSNSKKVQKAVKKIGKTPKVLRPGGTAPAASQKAAKTAQLVDRAKKTKNDRQKARLIGQMMRGET